MEKLFKTGRDRIQSVPKQSAQVTLQPCHNANSPLLNPTLFSLIIWFIFLYLVLFRKPSIFLFQTSNQIVQNKHAAYFYTASSRGEESLWVWMRQTSNSCPDDKTSIPFMSFWPWLVSGNQRHRRPHLLRGMGWDCCPWELPCHQQRAMVWEPGTREVQPQPLVHLDALPGSHTEETEFAHSGNK